MGSKAQPECDAEQSEAVSHPQSCPGDECELVLEFLKVLFYAFIMEVVLIGVFKISEIYLRRRGYGRYFDRFYEILRAVYGP